MIQAIHTLVEGRVRYKVRGLYRSNALKDHLTACLLRNEAVSAVTASALTGHVLVCFNSGNGPREIASLIESIVTGYHEGDDGGQHFTLREKEPTPLRSVPKRKSEAPGSLKNKLRKFLPSPNDQRTEPWHLMDVEAVLAAFATSATEGLSDAAARENLKRYGANTVPESDSRSRLSILLEQFKSLPVALLAAAAAVSVLTGGLADAVVILGVVAINGAVGYKTESEAERTIHSLKSLVRPAAHAVRNGCAREVRADELVPGDILILRPGTTVAADSRLIEVNQLSIDESALTGESMPACKTVDALPVEDYPIADRRNMAYMGTTITGGQGLAVVVSTGRFTEVGLLQIMIGEAASPQTPMERRLDRLGNQLVLISGAACALVFLIGLLRGYGLLRMFKTSISLAVAAVPEGLTAVATTTLALGISRMKKHHVLIRRLEAVETLGSVRTICFDKTGTITRNRMAVCRVYTGLKTIHADDGRFSTDGECVEFSSCEELARLVQVCVLCNETEVLREGDGYIIHGSPTERSLVEMAIGSSLDVIGLRQQYPLIKINYRSETRLFMGTLHEIRGKNGCGRLIALKGSPMEVLSMCDRHVRDGGLSTLTSPDRRKIELENERMAGDALRVLGVAYRTTDCEDEFGMEEGFTWLGLIAMADPVRSGVKALIRDFHRAGIDTVMITGDQGQTAYAIAKELDLGNGGQIGIVDSTNLAEIEADSMRALSERAHVFARVSPAHKLQIVRELQRAGRVVAMTGDGINDGPALKAADIGIAMGLGGTDVAREVADVVLENDNLETMIVAVRDGRTIHDNIRKALHFLLATNLSEILLMLFTIAAGLGTPLNAMQLLWINLMSDIFPGLALALEEPEPGILHRPPRPSDEPIVKKSDFKRLVFEATALSASALGVYAYGIAKYGTGARAGTVAFQGLTLAQLLHAVSCRSEKHSIFDAEKLPPNRYLNAALGGSLFLQFLTMVIPGLGRLLGLTSLSLADGLVIGGGAILPLLINEATKKPDQGGAP